MTAVIDVSEDPIDNILTNIREARTNVDTSAHWALDEMRIPLMRGDIEAFWNAYNRIGASHPDTFDHVTEAMYERVGAETIDDYEKVMGITQ